MILNFFGSRHACATTYPFLCIFCKTRQLTAPKLHDANMFMSSQWVEISSKGAILSYKGNIESSIKMVSYQDVFLINTSYLTDSYIVFTLKMESVSKNTIFQPKNDGEKWSRKNYFEIPPFESHFLLNEFTSQKRGVLIKSTNSVITRSKVLRS